MKRRTHKPLPFEQIDAALLATDNLVSAVRSLLQNPGLPAGEIERIQRDGRAITDLLDCLADLSNRKFSEASGLD